MSTDTPPTAETPAVAAPQLLWREDLSEQDRIHLVLCRGCAATPGLSYYLVASTSTRPARAGRAYYLYRPGELGHITTVRALSMGVAIMRANAYLRGANEH
jgi:hypothetical protein